MPSIRSLIGAGVGAVVASAVSVALGAIPDSAGVVHACYQNVTSANKPLKLLDTGKAKVCPSGWKAVTWNQAGQPGQPGEPGPAGGFDQSKVNYVWSQSVALGSTAVASCPNGAIAIGGGFDGLQSDDEVTMSAALTDKSGWQVSALGNTGTFRAFAVCASS